MVLHGFSVAAIAYERPVWTATDEPAALSGNTAPDAAATDLFSAVFSGQSECSLPPRAKHVDDMWTVAYPEGWRLHRTYFRPMFVPFVLTDVNGDHTFCMALDLCERSTFGAVRAKLAANASCAGLLQSCSEMSDESIIYVPKAIIVASTQPAFGLLRHILLALLLAPDKIVSWAIALTSELTLPTAQGQRAIQFTVNNRPLMAIFPSLEQLPLLDLPAGVVFQLLSIRTIFKLIAALMLDRKVIIRSANYVQLTLVCDTIRTLMYPLDLHTGYISLLPKQQLGYVELPSMYCYGIHQSFIIPEIVCDDEDYPVIVDVDEDKIFAKKDIMDIPEIYLTRLWTDLRRALMPDVMSSEHYDSDASEDMWNTTKSSVPTLRTAPNHTIQVAFLEMFLSLLGDFGDYILFTRIVPTPKLNFEKIRYSKKKSALLRQPKFVSSGSSTNDSIGSSISTNFMAELCNNSMVFTQFVHMFGYYSKSKLFTAMIAERKRNPSAPVPKYNQVPAEVTFSPASSVAQTFLVDEAIALASCGDLPVAVEDPIVQEDDREDASTFEAYNVEMDNKDVHIPLEPRFMDDDDVEAERSRKVEYANDDVQSDEYELQVLFKLALKNVAAGFSYLYNADFLMRLMQDSRPARILFVFELRAVCATTSDVKLQDDGFEWLASLLRSLLLVCFRDQDTRTLHLLVPLLLSFSRTNETDTVLCHRIADLLEENRAIIDDMAMWEELTLVAIDHQRRLTLNRSLVQTMKMQGFRAETLQDVINFTTESEKTMKDISRKEEELVSEQIKIFIATLIALNFNFEEVRRFSDRLTTESEMSEEYSQKLQDYLKQVIIAYTDRQMAIANKAKQRPRPVHGVEVRDMPEFTKEFLPGEVAVLQAHSVTYVSPLQDIAEGSFMMTNYCLYYRGQQVRGPAGRRRFVNFEITLGSIVELKRTEHREVTENMWAPEGILVKTADANLIQLCFDDDVSELTARDVSSKIKRYRSAPRSERFVYLYDGSEFKLKEYDWKHELAKLWLRPAAFTSENNIKGIVAIDPIEYAHSVEMKDLDLALLGFDDRDISDHYQLCNEKYQYCPTYSHSVVVPSFLKEDDLQSLSKYYAKKRFPCVTWVHPKNHRVLMRSSLAKTQRSNDSQRNDSDALLLRTLAKQRLTIVTENNGSEAPRGMTDDSGSFALRYNNVEVLNVKNPTKQRFSISGINSRFLSLITVCNSGEPDKDQQAGYLSLIADNWLYAIEDILSNALTVAKLLEDQSTNVLVSFEDGMDRTLQITSITQILLDPFYRTIHGFQVLIEKEWIRAGHPFADRCTPPESKATEQSPIFLQFLDCVWQLTKQFPTEFEFNGYYLRVIAQETYNKRFGTFIYLSELNHFEEGRTSDEVSVWEYINTLHMHKPVFYNFRYMVPLKRVLRPCVSLAALHLWEHYFLGHYFTAFSIKGAVASSVTLASFQEDRTNTLFSQAITDLDEATEDRRKKENRLTKRPLDSDTIPPWLLLWTAQLNLKKPLVELPESEVFGIKSAAVAPEPSTPKQIDVVTGVIEKRGQRAMGVVDTPFRVRRFKVDFSKRSIVYYQITNKEDVRKGEIPDAITDVCIRPNCRLDIMITSDDDKRQKFELRVQDEGELYRWANVFRRFAKLPMVSPPMVPPPTVSPPNVVATASSPETRTIAAQQRPTPKMHTMLQLVPNVAAAVRSKMSRKSMAVSPDSSSTNSQNSSNS